MKFSKIGTKILATVLPVLFIATLSMAVIVHFASRSRIDLETEQKMFAMLDTEAAKIDDVLNKNASIIQALVGYARSASKEDFLSGRFASFLLEIIPTGANTIGGGFWFEPYYLKADVKYFGPYVMRGEHGGHHLTYMYSNEQYDYPNTEWYIRGKNSPGPVVWEDVYYDWVSGVSMLTGTQPVYDHDGKFIGTCTADMDDDEIRHVIREIRVGSTGRAFLISSRGQYLAFDAPGKTPEMLITEDANPSLASLGREMMENEKGISSMERLGALHRVYYRTLPAVGWKLGIAIEESEISAPARSLTMTMLFVTLLALGAMFMVTMLLARHMHRIIGSINSFSTLAASGHLEERIHLDTRDEFSSIAANLNLMMENLERLSQAKGDFLSRMSHEIRTPLNAIVGMADLGQDSKDHKKIMECLDNIKSSSNHLIGIINDILDFSKAEAGKLQLDNELFSLSEEMDFVTSMLSAQISAKNIDFRLNLKNIRHDCINSDPLRLSQVLINLLSNALKFTESGGFIRLQVEEKSFAGGVGVYRFAVRDSGIGIEPEVVQRMFNPFEQASGHFGGTGLGLAISKSIVEMMGGQMEVESVLTEGSTFSFSITVKAFAASACRKIAASEDAEPDVPDCSGRHILVVDDMEMNRKITGEFLRKTGAETEFAENGREAVAKFMASPVGYYDLVLMDVQMPILDGYAATGQIRSSARADAGSVKIVAMTANALPEDMQHVLKAGMDRHLPKPVTMAAMFRLLQEMLL